MLSFASPPICDLPHIYESGNIGRKQNILRAPASELEFHCGEDFRVVFTEGGVCSSLCTSPGGTGAILIILNKSPLEVLRVGFYGQVGQLKYYNRRSISHDSC